MKNFDEYRNFYENDAPLGVSGGSGLDPELAEHPLPAPKTYKEYVIAKVLDLGKITMPTEYKEVIIKAGLGEWHEDHGELTASLSFEMSDKDWGLLDAYFGTDTDKLLDSAYSSDGSKLDKTMYSTNSEVTRLIYIGDSEPDISGNIIFKILAEVYVYQPKTFAEHALAVYIKEEDIEDIPTTLAPKTTTEQYLAEAIGFYGRESELPDPGTVNPGK